MGVGDTIRTQEETQIVLNNNQKVKRFIIRSNVTFIQYIDNNFFVIKMYNLPADFPKNLYFPVCNIMELLSDRFLHKYSRAAVL